ncbi:unnamed protein product [Trichogramma brassicae]|uniref:Uncharacterized protein n=1 Tax=Trichogramma brassicae TaxID=86971 RepID=A0A6H5HWF9_9HYME|nr:unnamed protein product [Trichogramma brassicae]
MREVRDLLSRARVAEAVAAEGAAHTGGAGARARVASLNFSCTACALGVWLYARSVYTRVLRRAFIYMYISYTALGLATAARQAHQAAVIPGQTRGFIKLDIKYIIRCRAAEEEEEASMVVVCIRDIIIKSTATATVAAVASTFLYSISLKPASFSLPRLGFEYLPRAARGILSRMRLSCCYRRLPFFFEATGTAYNKKT